MKNKTSITLSTEILREIDEIIANESNRSAFIEKALRNYLNHLKKEKRNNKDLRIINTNASRLNKEAEDVLTYQVEI
ncbi:MAG: ribbon-helix-helix domain-containing protein [Spirochaetota bacterium]